MEYPMYRVRSEHYMKHVTLHYFVGKWRLTGLRSLGKASGRKMSEMYQYVFKLRSN